jgi:putative phosphoribosyl transferase
MLNNLSDAAKTRRSNSESVTQYADRRHAGRFLASKLQHYKNRDDAIVLALPRGGVPVAFEVAEALDAPLDVFIVRKLGTPLYEELAMGAIASGGVRVLNYDIIDRLEITDPMIEAAVQEEEQELRRRELRYRGDRPPLDVKDRTVILVDDGLATGATMRAAIQALRTEHTASIVVAVPIAAKETCHQLQSEADEVICAKTPEPFMAVGRWYADFTQTTDEEVYELINHAAHQRRVRRVGQQKNGNETPYHQTVGSVASGDHEVE